MPFKLSPSSLNLMQECPRCFWLEQHNVWSRPSGPFPSLPSGMDSILKRHFDKFMERGKLPPELCERKECSGMKLFDDREKLKEWRNARKGLWFEDDGGNVLHGGIDNLLMKGGKLVILDYKTRGFALKEDTAEKYRLQLDVYAFLLEKMGYEVEDHAFLLFYYPKEVLETGEVVFDTQLVRIKVDMKSAEKAFKDAVRLLNGKCPEKACDWCERV